MTDKNFKLPKAMKQMIGALGKKDNVFKKLIIEAEQKFQQNKNRKIKKDE